MSLQYLAGHSLLLHLNNERIPANRWRDLLSDSSKVHDSSNVEEVANLIHAYSRNAFSTTADDNPLKEEMKGFEACLSAISAEDPSKGMSADQITGMDEPQKQELARYNARRDSKEQQIEAERRGMIEQFIPQAEVDASLLERFHVKPPLKEVLVDAFLKYSLSQGANLDPLQMACFDLTIEADADRIKYINDFIAEYIKHLSFYHIRTELTKKLNAGRVAEAKQYLSMIPSQHRKAFFQIVDSSGITILHNAMQMQDEGLVNEVFDKLQDLPEAEFHELLKKKARFRVSATVSEDRNVLSYAIRNGSLKMVKKIIEKRFPRNVLVDMLASNAPECLFLCAIQFPSNEPNSANRTERGLIMKSIFEEIKKFSPEDQKRCIPRDTLMAIISRLIPKAKVVDFPFLDIIRHILKMVKDDELKFSLLKATTKATASNPKMGFLQFAVLNDNEQLALAILKAINTLTKEKQIELLPFEILGWAVFKKMKTLARELLKTIPPDIKHEHLKSRMTVTQKSGGETKTHQVNPLECAMLLEDEILAIGIFKEISKLDSLQKRACISSNLLYRAIRGKMPNLASLILNSIKMGENSLEESYFVEFMQYSQEYTGEMELGELKPKNALQLALKFKYVEISKMMLERIKQLDRSDQIKCLLSDSNIFQYFLYIKDNNLLKETLETVLAEASEEELDQIFSEERREETRKFLEEYLMKSVDENSFINVFKMISQKHAHRYLSNSLLIKALKARKFEMVLALIKIVKNFTDNNQKMKVLFNWTTSVLFEAIKKKNVLAIRAILSVFETSTEHQLRFLRYGNSTGSTALHHAARLLGRKEDKKNIIQIILESIPIERRSEFLERKTMDLHNPKSVLEILPKDEIEEYISPMLSQEEENEEEENSAAAAEPKLKKAKTDASSSSSSSSAFSANSNGDKKRKR